MFSNKSDTEQDNNCQDHLLKMGDPQRYRTPIPDTPFIPSGSDDIPPTLSKKKGKKESHFTSEFFNIKCPRIKTCLSAVQRSAISLGQYTFSFICSFHWHFVTFLTGRGLQTALTSQERERPSLYGMPPQ